MAKLLALIYSALFLTFNLSVGSLVYDVSVTMLTVFAKSYAGEVYHTMRLCES